MSTTTTTHSAFGTRFFDEPARARVWSDLDVMVTSVTAPAVALVELASALRNFDAAVDRFQSGVRLEVGLDIEVGRLTYRGEGPVVEYLRTGRFPMDVQVVEHDEGLDS